MDRFCSECGCELNSLGKCPNCEHKKIRNEDNWFQKAPDLEPLTEPKAVIKTDETEKNMEFTPPVSLLEREVKESGIPGKIIPEKKVIDKKIPKKKTTNNKRIVVISSVCVVLAIVFAIACFLIFNNDDASNKREKSQEDYLIDISYYSSIDDFDVKINEFGEKIAIGEVSCPDYYEIYRQAYQDLNIDSYKNNKEINAVFFERVYELLNNNDSYKIVEISVNLNEENLEKTEMDSWSDEEIITILEQRVAKEEYEEFCLDMILEYAPEVTEEGLLGE